MTETEAKRLRNQRLFVAGQFRERGVVSAHDMNFNHGITRLAGIIWTLREHWGHDAIVTEREPGHLATYRLVRQPETWVPPRKARAKRGWHCGTCGERTLTVDQRLGPTLGKSACDTCGKVTMFRLSR